MGKSNRNNNRSSSGSGGGSGPNGPSSSTKATPAKSESASRGGGANGPSSSTKTNSLPPNDGVPKTNATVDIIDQDAENLMQAANQLPAGSGGNGSNLGAKAKKSGIMLGSSPRPKDSGLDSGSSPSGNNNCSVSNSTVTNQQQQQQDQKSVYRSRYDYARDLSVFESVVPVQTAVLKVPPPEGASVSSYYASAARLDSTKNTSTGLNGANSSTGGGGGSLYPGYTTQTWSWLSLGAEEDLSLNLDPVVFLAGETSGPECFFYIMDALSAKGYKCIAVSPPPFYTIEEFAQGFGLFLDHVQSRRCHLFGSGLGGYLAQCYAAISARRVASMILCNSFCQAGSAWTSALGAGTIISMLPVKALQRLVLKCHLFEVDPDTESSLPLDYNNRQRPTVLERQRLIVRECEAWCKSRLVATPSSSVVTNNVSASQGGSGGNSAGAGTTITETTTSSLGSAAANPALLASRCALAYAASALPAKTIEDSKVLLMASHDLAEGASALSAAQLSGDSSSTTSPEKGQGLLAGWGADDGGNGADNTNGTSSPEKGAAANSLRSPAKEVSDEELLPSLKELRQRYRGSKVCYIKFGGAYPFLCNVAETTLMIEVFLRNAGYFPSFDDD